MADYDNIKRRGENLKKMMNESLSPDRAWDNVHPHHLPPKKYANPNFLTNPDINDPRNFDENGGNDESDDFYDYLSDDEEHKHDDERKPKQHAVDDEETMLRIRELEKKKRLDIVRENVNNEAQNNYLIHQINKTRTVDPFPKIDEPIVLQLYLRIYGAYYMNPRDISLVTDGDKKLSDLNVFRNSFIQYKDIPKGKKQRTSIEFNTNSPIFNHKAYFPIIVRQDLMELLGKFSFLFEVWDQVSTDKQS